MRWRRIGNWVAQLYGQEMSEVFLGGFAVVDPSSLLMGMVSEVRSGGVGWRE